MEKRNLKRVASPIAYWAAVRTDIQSAQGISRLKAHVVECLILVLKCRLDWELGLTLGARVPLLLAVQH